MKHIYMLSSCDEWKSWSSMDLIMASVSLKKIKSEIVNQIKKGTVEYKRGIEELSKTAQIRMMKEDYKNESEEFVFDNLEYCSITEVIDGEIQ